MNIWAGRADQERDEEANRADIVSGSHAVEGEGCEENAGWEEREERKKEGEPSNEILFAGRLVRIVLIMRLIRGGGTYLDFIVCVVKFAHGVP